MDADGPPRSRLRELALPLVAITLGLLAVALVVLALAFQN